MTDRGPTTSRAVAPPPVRRISEERIAELAANQHGVVARAQLMELGLSGAAIGRRLRRGRLPALHAGVYLVGPIEPDPAAEMAAVLAGGPAAVLSHTNALRLWRLLRIAAPRPVHVTVPGSGRSRRPGYRIPSGGHPG